jgi:hypothetical protein
MISAATTLPMPKTGPSVNRNWIKANALAAAVYAAFGILTFATDKVLGVNDPSSAILIKGIGTAVALAGTIIPIVIYALLTGSVIGEKLPRFSRRAWVALHASIGTVLGLGIAALTFFGMVSNNASAPTPSLSVLITGLGFAAVFAAMFGALMGGLQALVLRKAASGVGKWIALSALATPLMIVALGATAFAVGPSSGFGGALGMQAAMFAAMIGAAIVMLPALNRLTPRG